MDNELATSKANTAATQIEKNDVQTGTYTHLEDQVIKPVSGIEQHLRHESTPEEKKAEKRFVLKTDFIVLPLLASMYFLATLVTKPSSFDLESRTADHVPGPWRRGQRSSSWIDR